jgi:antitoxin component of MazEF toxin-antitoxin module
MAETEQIFKTKLRKVGTSFGVLIPNRLIKTSKFKVGEEVEIALLKKQRIDLIEKAFGIAKGAKPFRRENADRV